MYNVGTKITFEPREEHTFCDGNTAIIWEVKTYEFNELAELSFRVTESDVEQCPLDWGYTFRTNLFDARKYIEERNEEREMMKNEDE